MDETSEYCRVSEVLQCMDENHVIIKKLEEKLCTVHNDLAEARAQNITLKAVLEKQPIKMPKVVSLRDSVLQESRNGIRRNCDEYLDSLTQTLETQYKNTFSEALKNSNNEYSKFLS